MREFIPRTPRNPDGALPAMEHFPVSIGRDMIARRELLDLLDQGDIVFDQLSEAQKSRLSRRLLQLLKDEGEIRRDDLSDRVRELLILTREEFIELLVEGNGMERRAWQRYSEHALAILLGERITVRSAFECSDGRVHLITPDLPTEQATEVRSVAGNRFSHLLDDITRNPHPAAALDRLLHSPGAATECAELFDQYDRMFKDDVESRLRFAQAIELATSCVANGNDPVEYVTTILDPTIAHLVTELLRYPENLPSPAQAAAKLEQIRQRGGLPVTFELQSHSAVDELHCAAGDKEHHGCGAWGCNTGSALDSTAVNALAMQAWFQSRFPDQVGLLEVIRSHHFTGTKEQVVDPMGMAELAAKMNPELRAALIAQGLEFPTEYLEDPDRHVVRERAEGKKSPLRLDSENHSEPAIYIGKWSNIAPSPYVSRLKYWPPEDRDLARAVSHKLFDIARDNYIEKLAQYEIIQPMMIVFDFPADDFRRAKDYYDMYLNLRDYAGQFSDRMQVEFIFTVTTGRQLGDSAEDLRIKFLSEDQLEVWFDEHVRAQAA